MTMKPHAAVPAWTVGLGAVLAAVVALPAPAPAQSGAGQAQEAEAGWIGVGLSRALRCETQTQARQGEEAEARTGCRTALVVEAVVQGSPAHEAGIQPGDTLVAVNGRGLATQRGRQELLSFEAGQPVALLVGRGSGRRSVRVVPSSRPEAPTAPAVARPGAPERWPGTAGREGAQSPTPWPLELAGGDRLRFAGIEVGEDGKVYLEQEGGERLELRVALEELETLAPTLRRIRDSVLVEAREHFRDLRRHYREAAQAQARAAARLQGGGPVVRAAGGEFRPLTPELAEYFPGARRGLLVLQVVPGTPAARLGLRSGDVVVEAGGRPVAAASDLRAAFARYPGQDSIVVKWIRKGVEAQGVLRDH